MPDGVMLWFDDKTDEGRIARGGHVYVAPAGEVEASARSGGARVHFDEDNDHVGIARKVRLRPGHRSSAHHHRHGTLVGARHADAKGPTVTDRFADPLLHLESRPALVAAAWAARIADGQLGNAVQLYAPNAIVHDATHDVVGRNAVLDLLAFRPAPRGPSRVAGESDHLTVRWHDGTCTALRINHGEIEEQWDGSASPETELDAWPFQLPVVARGRVSNKARTYAALKVAALADETGQPVLFARVKLTQHADPAARGTAVAEATLDVNGRVWRSRAAADLMLEAIDLAVSRLRRRLHDAHTGRPHTPEAVMGAGAWSEQPTLARGVGFARPIDEREVVRHKVVPDVAMSVAEAVEELEAMDLEFYLFDDLASGEDALVERRPDGVIELYLATPHGLAVAATPGVHVSELRVPLLYVTDAVEWLNVTGDGHVFFVDSVTTRGAVLYRRYDGHYGLIGHAS